MTQDFYELTSPAPELPLTFAQFQAWGRDIDVADTAIVDSLIEAAAYMLESMMNRIFVKRSFTGKFEGTQTSVCEPYPFIEIRKSPLISISEIRSNGAIVASSTYRLKESKGFSRVLFLTEPDVDVEDAYPIEIDFVAGYGLGSAVAITSIARVGAVATVTTTAEHNFEDDIFVVIAGAIETEYNGRVKITVIDSTSFSYSVPGTPTTPATGTITAAWEIPGTILSALKQLILFWYENRGDVSTDEKQMIPFVTKQIIKQYRIVNTYG